MDIINLATVYATEKHKGQKRKNGEDYINHPIAVSELVMKYKKSHNIKRLTAASLLHDVLEDTDTTYYDLVETFGYDIANIVKEVTINKEMKEALGKDKYLAYSLNSMTKWALVIKLCDRLHNVHGLDQTTEEFKNKYIKETKFIIDYVENNRELTNTHKEIIKDIKEVLKEYV